MGEFDAFEETYDFEWDVDGYAGFYQALARSSGGPVAQFACGTGRILIPLAREGLEVWGVQSAGPMAARFGRRLIDEPAEVRGRVHLVEAEPLTADLGLTFPLVFMASGGLQVNLTDDALHAQLATLACHVAPGGVLAFDLVRMSDVCEDYPGLVRHAWTMERARFRETVTRFEALTVGSEPGLLELTVFIDTVGETGSISRRVVSQQLRAIGPAQLESLLSPHGVSVESTSGTAAGAAPTQSSDKLFVVARKA